MLTVHHLGVSQSERIPWLCEELEIPYVLKRYDRDSKTGLAPAEYKALHPMEMAPVITDGNVALAESGAIMEYINTKYGKGRLALPPDHPDYANYLFWFYYANATLMPAGMALMVGGMIDPSMQNPMMGIFKKREDLGFSAMEDRLGKVQYFAGAGFTMADIIMFFPLTTRRAFLKKDLTPFPKLRAYLKRIGERPAYQKAMAASDPGMTLQLT